MCVFQWWGRVMMCISVVRKVVVSISVVGRVMVYYFSGWGGWLCVI